MRTVCYSAGPEFDLQEGDLATFSEIVSFISAHKGTAMATSLIATSEEVTNQAPFKALLSAMQDSNKGLAKLLASSHESNHIEAAFVAMTAYLEDCIPFKWVDLLGRLAAEIGSSGKLPDAFNALFSDVDSMAWMMRLRSVYVIVSLEVVDATPLLKPLTDWANQDQKNMSALALVDTGLPDVDAWVHAYTGVAVGAGDNSTNMHELLESFNVKLLPNAQPVPAAEATHAGSAAEAEVPAQAPAGEGKGKEVADAQVTLRCSQAAFRSSLDSSLSRKWLAWCLSAVSRHAIRACLFTDPERPTHLFT